VNKADALAYAYRSRAYFFASAEDMEKFADEPETFLANASARQTEDERGAGAVSPSCGDLSVG
jgi:YHS domain-containing protein